MKNRQHGDEKSSVEMGIRGSTKGVKKGLGGGIEDEKKAEAAKQAEDAMREEALEKKELAQAADRARSRLALNVMKHNQETDQKKLELELQALPLGRLVDRAIFSAENADYVNQARQICGDKKQEVDDFCSKALTFMAKEGKGWVYQVKEGCDEDAVKNGLILKIIDNERRVAFLDPRNQVISILIEEQKRLAKKYLKGDEIDAVLGGDPVAGNAVQKDAKKRMIAINEVIGRLERWYQADLAENNYPNFGPIAAGVRNELSILKYKIYAHDRRLGKTEISKAIKLVEEKKPKEDFLHRMMRKFGM